MPYKSIHKLVKELGYKVFHVNVQMNSQSVVSGSYIYNEATQQFVSYQSPQVIRSLCNYVKSIKLKGVILWSADNDLPISNPRSLIAAYRSGC